MRRVKINASPLLGVLHRGELPTVTIGYSPYCGHEWSWAQVFGLGVQLHGWRVLVECVIGRGIKRVRRDRSQHLGDRHVFTIVHV